MTPHRNRLSSLTVALTALTIGACTGSLDTGSPLTNTKLAGDIGVTARDEVEAALNALTLASLLTPVGTAQATPACDPLLCHSVNADRHRWGRGARRRHLYLHRAPLPVHRLAGRHPRPRGPAPDPGPGTATGAGFGYEATLTGLRTRFTSAGKRRDLRRHPERHPHPERLGRPGCCSPPTSR